MKNNILLLDLLRPYAVQWVYERIQLKKDAWTGACLGERRAMTVVGREQFIGESIRQLRRQRNLTQSELGGERYSKSYVSALERDKITPSFQALQFFAEQLGQSN